MVVSLTTRADGGGKGGEQAGGSEVGDIRRVSRWRVSLVSSYWDVVVKRNQKQYKH